MTEEPNVNTNEPSLFLAHSAAHETAHYLGYAAEEDANFLGYLVCEASNSHALKYSAAMHALVHCMSALYKADPDAYDEILALTQRRYCATLRTTPRTAISMRAN